MKKINKWLEVGTDTRRNRDGNERTGIYDQCKKRKYVDSVGSVDNKGNVE